MKTTNASNGARSQSWHRNTGDQPDGSHTIETIDQVVALASWA